MHFIAKLKLVQNGDEGGIVSQASEEEKGGGGGLQVDCFPVATHWDWLSVASE